jgi:hypothetical protein
MPYTSHGPGTVVHSRYDRDTARSNNSHFYKYVCRSKRFYQSIQSKMTLVYYMTGLDAILSQTSYDILVGRVDG